MLRHCEQQFKRVKGHASIDVLVAAINAIQREDHMPEAARGRGRRFGNDHESLMTVSTNFLISSMTVPNFMIICFDVALTGIHFR